MFEPGGKSLELYARDVHNWEELKQYVKLLKGSREFKTVVVDTVDLAYKQCYEAVCKKLGIDHPSEEGFAKAWNMIRDEFQKWMSELLKLDRGVIFVSHATEKEIKRRWGDTEHRIMTTMPKQAREVLEPMVDVWAYCEYGEHGEREFVIRGDELISAGHRLQNNFVGMDRISMGSTPEDAYHNFTEGFNNRVVNKGVRKGSENGNKQTKVTIKGRS